MTDVDGWADRFGGCPVCGRNEGYLKLNVFKSHWFKCDEHKTRWFAEEVCVDNLRLPTNYREVEPIVPSTDSPTV